MSHMSSVKKQSKRYGLRCVISVLKGLWRGHEDVEVYVQMQTDVDLI